MKALVTGASGFIGSTLIDRLGQEGFEVYAMMRKTSRDTNLRGLRYTRVEGDLADTESLRKAVAGMDVVFHLAGAIMARNRDEFMEHNAHGTARLAEAVASHGPSVKRLVYVSSIAAGGPSASREGKRESEADHPVSAYGESKRRGELALLKFRDRFEVVIVRPPIVYGPKDAATFILIDAVRKRVLPSLPSRDPAGEKFHSVVHAEDLVRGILAAAITPGIAGETFYLSSGETVTTDQLMREIATNLGVRTWKVRVPFFLLTWAAALLTLVGKLRGRPFILSLDKLNELRPDYWVCSNQKACEQLGFSPRYTLTEGMKMAIQWYRENGWIRS